MSQRNKKYYQKSTNKPGNNNQRAYDLTRSVFSTNRSITNNTIKPSKNDYKRGQYTTKADTKTNINISRRIPQLMECNGVVVKADTREQTTTEKVGTVTAFASFYKIGADGVLANTLMSNILSTIDRLGTNNTVMFCMAWFSHKLGIKSLKRCSRVLGIVNRENYDIWGGGCMKTAYNELPKFQEPLWKAYPHINTPLCSLDRHLKKGQSSYAPVRAFGNPSNMSTGRTRKYRGGNESATINTGFEHCKYFIFFKKMPVHSDDGRIITLDCPNSVLTCSSNMTKTSETHHENAILIEDNPEIALHYMLDHNATFMNSVPVYSKNKKATPMSNQKKNRITMSKK